MEAANDLELTLAKLRLKEFETIEKLSEPTNEHYVLRAITSPNSRTFLSLNGDWERVTGHTQEYCKGKQWSEFVHEESKEDTDKATDRAEKEGGFKDFICQLKGRHGERIPSIWSAKYYDTLNAIVCIGRVHKADMA